MDISRKPTISVLRNKVAVTKNLTPCLRIRGNMSHLRHKVCKSSKKLTMETGKRTRRIQTVNKSKYKPLIIQSGPEKPHNFNIQYWCNCSRKMIEILLTCHFLKFKGMKNRLQIYEGIKTLQISTVVLCPEMIFAQYRWRYFHDNCVKY